MEEGAVDRHQLPGQEIELACQQYELAIGGLQRLAVLLAEVGDRAIARRQPVQQPHHFDIATRLALKTTRGPNLIQVTVQV